MADTPLLDLTDQLQRLIRGRLWLQVLIGLLLGIVTVAVIGNWLALPGSLFLTLVRMIIVPLVFASVILGLASSSNVGQFKVLGSIGAAYFLMTTVVATSIGLALEPGHHADPELVRVSIGSPATPGAGIVILAMVLEGVGIPAAGIGLLIGVDRILDMSRISANVVDDVTACLVEDRFVPSASKEKT